MVNRFTIERAKAILFVNISHENQIKYTQHLKYIITNQIIPQTNMIGELYIVSIQTFPFDGLFSFLIHTFPLYH